MKRMILIGIAAVMLLGAPASAFAGDCVAGKPCISKPTFILRLDNRMLLVNLEYSGIAGDITEAKFTVVMSVVINPKTEQLHSIPVGNLLAIARTDDPSGKFGVNEGVLNMFLLIPDSIDIGDGKKISGFGLVVVDSRGERSPPVFVEVEPSSKQGALPPPAVTKI